MFRFIYYLVAVCLYILVLPYLLLKKRTPKYSEAIPAKFFLHKNTPFEANKIWFHSCSMGETKALEPFLKSFDPCSINISVITNTGFAQAKRMVSNVRYLPYEIFLPFWIRPQKVLVVMEAELWYMLFLVAQQKNTKTVLINARINDKSYKKYQRFRFFYKQLFKHVDKIFAQTISDKERLEALGAKNIEVIGNIKLASLPQITNPLKKPTGTIITAGSTHEGEESMILDGWKKTNGKLILVPRHPERFDEVYDLLLQRYKQSDVSFQRYSESKNFASDITLVDVMGELINIYAISDVVILGGGFIKTAGGHNPIEPAFFNTVLLSGKVIFNQKSLFECVNNYYLIEENEIQEYLAKSKDLLKSRLGEAGSVTPIVDYIKDI